MQFIIVLLIVAIVFFMWGKIRTDHRHDAKLSIRSAALSSIDRKLQKEIEKRVQ